MRVSLSRAEATSSGSNGNDERKREDDFFSLRFGRYSKEEKKKMARFYERAILAKEIERVGKEFFLSFFLSFLSFFLSFFDER